MAVTEKEVRQRNVQFRLIGGTKLILDVYVRLDNQEFETKIKGLNLSGLTNSTKKKTTSCTSNKNVFNQFIFAIQAH